MGPAAISMSSWLEWSACTRTVLWFQALTVIEPPKLLTSSRTPGRTAIVVSVCGSASAASAANVSNMVSILS